MQYYGLDDRGLVVRFPDSVQTRSTATESPLQWVDPWVNRLCRETDHSSVSAGEVKSGGTVPPLPYTSP